MAWIRLTFFFVAISPTLGIAAPATPSVLFAGLRVESDSVLEREPFSVTIVVRGNVRPRRPDTSGVRDFRVAYIGSRSRQAQGETLYQYRFVPRRLGTLEIPPIPVIGGTVATKTARALIHVEPGPAIDGLSLDMGLDPKHAYVGQQVRVRLRFRHRGSVNVPELMLPFADDHRLETMLTDLGAVVPLPEGRERIRVNHNNAVATGVIAQDATELTYEAIIRPLRWGRIRFEPATVRALSRDGKALAHSTALDLEVKPLPPGAPPEFAGLVGRHDLRVEIEPRRATLGEPLELTLTLSGQPYLEDVRAPDVEQALGDAFRVYREPAAMTSEGKIFRYKIRPNRGGDVVVRALSYAYFDPEQERYVSRRTDPIRLRIDDPPATASVSPAAPAPQPPQAVPAPLIEAPERPTERPSSPLLYCVLALCALAASILALRRRKPSAPPSWDIPPPTPLQTLRIDLARDPSEEFQAFRRYLGRRLELSAGALTFAEASIELRRRHVADHLVEETRAVFEDADARRFGAADGRSRFEGSVRDLAERLDAALLEDERV